MRASRLLLSWLTAAALSAIPSLLVPQEAHAFCGFFVSDVEQPLYNDATQVVLMREGTRTVLSMRNNYRGPASDFAMVVPVPQVLEREHVKTLDDELFDKVSRFSAPRLVQYYERDPCSSRRSGARGGFRMQKNVETSMAPQEESNDQAELGVSIEAQFEVGEYEILILGAKDSSGLQTWLEREKYSIPKGAAGVLAPYVAQGMYFFVARVNADKVRFDASGEAVLSPLRFHYDSEDFSLPVRLGLLNAQGPQDLLIHIISREGRYEMANLPNVPAPTNLIVDKKVRPDFMTFYEQLFAATLKANPGAVVTEFAWGGSPGPQHSPPAKCDPCVEPPQDSTWASRLWSLGAQVLPRPEERAPLDWQRAIIEVKARILATQVAIVEPPAPLQSPESEGAVSEPAPAPRTLFSYDAADFQDVLTAQLPAMEDCQQSLLRAQGDAIPTAYNFELSINPDGTLGEVKDAGSSSQDAQLAAQAHGECLRRQGVRIKPPGEVSVTLLASVQFEARVGAASELEITQYTVTRLHARYTASELKEDLVFRKAAPIMGGRGTPQGVNPVMDTSVSKAPVNNFQARYMILHPYEDFHFCWRPSRGVWTGGINPDAATSAMTSSLKPGQDFDLSEVIKSGGPRPRRRSR